MNNYDTLSLIQAVFSIDYGEGPQGAGGGGVESLGGRAEIQVPGLVLSVNRLGSSQSFLCGPVSRARCHTGM